jgi:hypothetical protein
MATTRPCQRCQGEIPPERLEILPDTRLCVRCSQEIGGDYVVTVVSENLGKAGSLKKNYGSASIRKKRRVITPIERPAD